MPSACSASKHTRTRACGCVRDLVNLASTCDGRARRLGWRRPGADPTWACAIASLAPSSPTECLNEITRARPLRASASFCRCQRGSDLDRKVAARESGDQGQAAHLVLAVLVAISMRQLAILSALFATAAIRSPRLSIVSRSIACTGSLRGPDLAPARLADA